MNIVFTMRDISPEETLSQNLFGFGVALINIIFLENYLLLLSHIVIWMYYVVISFVELIITFIYFWS